MNIIESMVKSGLYVENQIVVIPNWARIKIG